MATTINLQSLKLMYKSEQKYTLLLLKLKKLRGTHHALSRPHPLCVPSIRPLYQINIPLDPPLAATEDALRVKDFLLIPPDLEETCHFKVCQPHEDVYRK